MERVIELTQEWEGNDVGATVFVHSDTYALLVENERGKAVDHDKEISMLVARANEQAKADVEEAEKAGLTDEQVKTAVTEIVNAERKGGDPPPQMQTKDLTDDRGMQHPPTSAEIGWKSTAHFWHAIGNACAKDQPYVDPRLTDRHIATKVVGFHEINLDVQGGFLVPDDVRQELMKERLENAVVRGNGARVIPTIRDNIVLTRIDDPSHANSVFGNVVFFWRNERAALTERNLLFGQVQIPIEKLTGLTYITNELLGDAFVSVEAEVRQSFSEGAAWFEDDAFLNGNGAGMPEGILNSGAKIAVGRSGGAGTVTYPDIANIYARQRFPGRAVWVANQTILPQLLQMTGGTEVIWIGLSSGATQAPPGSLLGRPIIFTEKLPALGTQDDLMFLDISNYIIGDRENIRIDRSDDIRFLNDEIALRFILRVGGTSRTDVAFQPNNGTTLSTYVGLN